jgi:hypothetical protein
MRAVHRVTFMASKRTRITQTTTVRDERALRRRRSRKQKANVVLILFVLALLGWLLVNRTRQVAVPHPQRIVAQGGSRCERSVTRAV